MVHKKECTYSSIVVDHDSHRSTCHCAHTTPRSPATHTGGPIATRFFAPHPTVLQVGSTLFVHGGVLGKHVEYGLNRINAETQQWLLGRSGDTPPAFLRGANAVVWARDFSMVDERQCDCEGLKAVLENVPGAQRMVVSGRWHGSNVGAWGFADANCEGVMVVVPGAHSLWWCIATMRHTQTAAGSLGSAHLFVWMLYA